MAIERNAEDTVGGMVDEIASVDLAFGQGAGNAGVDVAKQLFLESASNGGERARLEQGESQETGVGSEFVQSPFDLVPIGDKTQFESLSGLGTERTKSQASLRHTALREKNAEEWGCHVAHPFSSTEEPAWNERSGAEETPQ